MRGWKCWGGVDVTAPPPRGTAPGHAKGTDWAGSDFGRGAL
jgi:hypothetical protein